MPNEVPDPIKVGIIGLSARGGWAARAHVPALAAIPGYEVTALCASSPESAKAAGEKFGIEQRFHDPAALAESDVDMVVVTVKVSRHKELVVPALRAGKAVLSEWPLGNGLAEAEELAELAKDQGVATAVGLQARSAPVINYVRDLVAQGFVGTVLSTTMIGSGSTWGADVTPDHLYLLDAAEGASMLTIPFGHTVDAFTKVLGDFAELQAGTAIRRPTAHDRTTGIDHPRSVPDQLVVSGILDSGAVAAIHYRGGLSRGTNFHWEINGTDGDLVISGPTGHLQLGLVTVRGAGAGEAELRELPTPASYQQVSTVDSDDPAYAVAHAYANLKADLRAGGNRVPDFTHAVGTHRLLAAIEEAAGSGRRQKL